MKRIIILILILYSITTASALTCDKAVGGALWVSLDQIPSEIIKARGYGSDCYNAMIVPSQINQIRNGGTDYISTGITQAHSKGMRFIIRISPRNWVSDNSYDTFKSSTTAQTNFKTDLTWILNRYPSLDGIEIEEPQSYNLNPSDGGYALRTFNNIFFAQLKTIASKYHSLTDGSFMWSFNSATNYEPGLSRVGFDIAYINNNRLFNMVWSQDSKATVNEFQGVYTAWKNRAPNLKVGLWTYVVKDTVDGYSQNFFEEVKWTNSQRIPTSIFTLTRLSYSSSHWPNDPTPGSTAGEKIKNIWGTSPLPTITPTSTPTPVVTTPVPTPTPTITPTSTPIPPTPVPTPPTYSDPLTDIVAYLTSILQLLFTTPGA